MQKRAGTCSGGKFQMKYGCFGVALVTDASDTHQYGQGQGWCAIFCISFQNKSSGRRWLRSFHSPVCCCFPLAHKPRGLAGIRALHAADTPDEYHCLQNSSAQLSHLSSANRTLWKRPFLHVLIFSLLVWSFLSGKWVYPTQFLYSRLNTNNLPSLHLCGEKGNL